MWQHDKCIVSCIAFLEWFKSCIVILWQQFQSSVGNILLEGRRPCQHAAGQSVKIAAENFEYYCNSIFAILGVLNISAIPFQICQKKKRSL